VIKLEKKYQIRSVPRMFEEVTRQIISYIHIEKIPIGGKLPTERKLSELLEVSRSSVREGLRILELLKYVESRQGGGTFVAEPRPFLLPIAIVNQEMEAPILHQYFEVGLVQAEQIIFTAMSQEIQFEKSDSSKQFWKKFNGWVNDLGGQIDNDFFLQLWNSVYLLLEDRGFFRQFSAMSDISKLQQAYLEKNYDSLRQFFSEAKRR
jgi:GntR family transcriptional repressor for pyruvate dehydrogenase complex